MKISAIKTAVLSLLCVAMLGAVTASAQETLFEGWRDGDTFYRFDKQTGDVQKLMKPQGAPMVWVRCEVAEPKPAPKSIPATQVSPFAIQQQIPQPAQPVKPSTNNNAVQLIDPVIMPSITADQPLQPKPAIKRLRVWNDRDEEITDKIDDSDRQANRALINSYDGLHVSHTLKTSGDRISGIVILENKGNRKISMMELTMTVRVVGKEKPIEHKRFIFTDKGDATADHPPAPSFGNSGLSVLKKIDVLTPSGVINGMPEVRVTYLRFDDRE